MSFTQTGEILTVRVAGAELQELCVEEQMKWGNLDALARPVQILPLFACVLERGVALVGKQFEKEDLALIGFVCLSCEDCSVSQNLHVGERKIIS